MNLLTSTSQVAQKKILLEMAIRSVNNSLMRF